MPLSRSVVASRHRPPAAIVLFAKKRARASDYSDCSGRFPLSCAAGSARRYASVESSLGPNAAFPGTQSKYASGHNFRRATTDNIAGDLGGRQSTRLISCKVIDVRVATSCTSRAPLPSPSPAMGEVPEQAVDGPRGEALTLLGGIDLQIRGFRLHRVARCRRP